MRVDSLFQRTSRFAASLGLLGLFALLSGCGQTLEITPTRAQAAVGTTLQLRAATLDALVATDVTSQVSWSSSNSAVATISSTGLVSTVSPGSVTISARLSGSSASMSLTVTAAALVSIGVTPANPSLPNGLTEQFIATGVFSDNSTQDLTGQVSWLSSSPNVATASNTAGTAGVASADGIGTTTVTARSGNISGSTTLTVTSATLVSIQVTPATPSTPKGVSRKFTATGVFSDNSTQNLTAQVTWASSNTAVATISNTNGSQGLASTTAVGSTTISAASGTISGSTTLTVTSASLVSITLTPANPSIANGLTEQFTATGTYSDNTTQNLTTQITWSSSNTTAATISNASGSQGLASTAAVGSTTLSASSGAVSGSTTLTVTSASLVSLALTPANPSIANGLTEQFTATGAYTDSSTHDLTTQVTWTSSNISVATISNAAGSQGLASSASLGNSTISASSASISGSMTLTVTSATLVSIAISPANPSIADGFTEQFTATGTYTDNSTQDLTTVVTWASADTAVATISNAAGSQGLASSASLGSITISATSASISGTTGLSVTTCDNGFTNCEVLTIDHTKVGSSDSSNFPMLFSGTYSYLATVANGGSVANTTTEQGISVPADAVFTSDSGCTSPLNWEVESYDPTTGAANIWVQIPMLSHTADTMIYLCVGNPSVTSFQGGPTGATWDSNFAAVYHFPNATTLSTNDSTSFANNGTNHGATATTGQIAGGINFASVASQYVGLGNSSSLDIGATDFTISYWLNAPDANQFAHAFGKLDPNMPYSQWESGVGYVDSGKSANSAKTIYFFCYDGANTQSYYTTNSVVDGNWHYVVTTRTNGVIAIYIDGSSVPLTAALSNTSSVDCSNPADANIAYNNVATYYNGSLDEVRLSPAIARSADWITAEYNNQSSPATFYTVAQN